ncbi:hypothetical protein W690_02664, partial [Staphylococcus aureus VET0596R]
MEWQPNNTYVIAQNLITKYQE